MKSTEYIKQAGFTLIELMFVIVITGLLLAIGLPAFNVLKNNNCLTTNTNILVASLQFARSEAAKRNTTASLAPRDGAWRNGFLIRTNEVDLDGDGDCEGIENADASTTTTCDNDVTIRIIELGCGDSNAAKGLQVNFVNTAGVEQTSIQYRSNGRLETSHRRRTFTICMSGHTGTERGRQVQVTNVGRPVTTRVDIAACPA